MSVFDTFEFDLSDDDEIISSENDIFKTDKSYSTIESENLKRYSPDNKEKVPAEIFGKRNSADFLPDMELILLTAQSSMLLEAKI